MVDTLDRNLLLEPAIYHALPTHMIHYPAQTLTN
jgi:hypothetical protein